MFQKISAPPPGGKGNIVPPPPLRTLFARDPGWQFSLMLVLLARFLPGLLPQRTTLSMAFLYNCLVTGAMVRAVFGPRGWWGCICRKSKYRRKIFFSEEKILCLASRLFGLLRVASRSDVVKPASRRFAVAFGQA